MISNSKTFSIGDTAKITEVSQKQLRNWEARGYIPAPTRVVCGKRAYRHFTKKQVELIQAIKRFLDEGYALPHASRLAKKSNGKEDA
jgi:MerR family transcriptional regulator, redox-sensitive transcriptional activator SoxR